MLGRPFSLARQFIRLVSRSVRALPPVDIPGATRFFELETALVASAGSCLFLLAPTCLFLCGMALVGVTPIEMGFEEYLILAALSGALGAALFVAIHALLQRRPSQKMLEWLRRYHEDMVRLRRKGTIQFKAKKIKKP